MSEYDERFTSNQVMQVMELENDYQAERDFTTLIAWQKAREVKLFFYKNIIPRLPKEEKYSLDIQIRKASVSSTANIAEGYGRYYYQEGIQFYRISIGSLYELKDHLISCFDLGYIDQDTVYKGQNLIETAKITLNVYINYIKHKK